MRVDDFDDLFAIEHSPRIRAIEGLYMRLLYSAECRASYAADPRGVLERAGLDPVDAAHLPTIEGSAHRIECHGRKMLASSQLARIYQAAFTLLGAPTPRAVASSAWCEEFLASDEFFFSASSLPSAFAIGRGYEGISRFFFWARERHRVLDPTGAFGHALHSAFGNWLIQQARSSRDPSLTKFARGGFWMNDDGRPGASVVTGTKCVQYGAGDATSLERLGLVDLEKLRP